MPASQGLFHGFLDNPDALKAALPWLAGGAATGAMALGGATDAEASGKLPPWAEELIRQLAERDFKGFIGPEVRDSVMRELSGKNPGYTNPFYQYGPSGVGHLFDSRIVQGKMTPGQVGELVYTNLESELQKVFNNRPSVSGRPDPTEVLGAPFGAKYVYSPVLPGSDGR